MRSAFFEFGPFRLHPDTRALFRSGEFVPITPKAFDTLLALVESAGSIVTKEELLQRVWPDAFVEEGSIANNISALRKTLNPYFDGDGPIATVARRGYRFTVPVHQRPGDASSAGAAVADSVGDSVADSVADEAVLHTAVAGVAVAARPAPAAPAAVRGRGGLRYAAVVSAIVAVVVFSVALRTIREARLPAPPRRSVAALAMRNLSGQAKDAWLSTALTETIGAELSAGGQLRLVSADNVVRTQQELATPAGMGLTRKQLDEVGRDLGCDLILTGEYLAVGGKVRVDVRLDAVATGESLASASATDDERNLLALVARAGGELRTKAGLSRQSSSDADAVMASFASDPDALRLYFEGIQALRLRDGPRARDFLTQSIAKDPNVALAHSALSTTWRLLGYDRKGTASAKRAFELSARLAREDRLSVEAQYAEASFNWPKAIDLYRSLWTTYPDNLEYGLKLANAQAFGGKPKDASATVAAMRKMPAADAADPRVDLLDATIAERLGDYRTSAAAALAAANKARASGARLLLARARIKQGIYASRLGDLRASLPFFEEAQTLFADLGDTGGVADAIRWQGTVSTQMGDLAASDEHFRAALGLATPLGYLRLITEILGGQSDLLRLRGQLTASAAAGERAVAAAREMEDRGAIARLENGLALILKARGEYSRAVETLRDAVRLNQEVGDDANAHAALSNIALIDLTQGRADAARRQFEALLVEDRRAGSKTRMATRLTNLAVAAALQGRLADAEQFGGEECQLQEATGGKSTLMTCRVRLALVRLELGRAGDARALLETVSVADLAGTLQPAPDLARAANAYLRLGDRTKAAAFVAEAEKVLAKREFSPEQMIPVAIAQARLDLASGQTAAAIKRLTSAQADAEKFGVLPLAYEARLTLAENAAPAVRRAQLDALERDASQAGLGLIAKRAATSSSSPHAPSP